MDRNRLVMKEPKTLYAGAALFFEHPADDGWPEDAGWWPERIVGCTLHTVNCSDERVHGVNHLSLSQFIKSLMQSRNRR
jgi:hypothetical protein